MCVSYRLFVRIVAGLCVWIVQTFLADCGGRPVSGVYAHRVGQDEKFLLYASEQIAPVAPWQVATAYAVLKEGIAAEQIGCFFVVEADASPAVSGSMDDAQGGFSEGDFVSMAKGTADRGRFAQFRFPPFQPQLTAVPRGFLQPFGVAFVCFHRQIVLLGKEAQSEDMVGVQMRAEQSANRQPFLFYEAAYGFSFLRKIASRVDEGGLFRSVVYQKTVFLKRVYGESLDGHGYGRLVGFMGR